MSNPYMTDGLYVYPPIINNESKNAFESITRAIAFDSRDWCSDGRSAWIYIIVFGCDDDCWYEISSEFGWDDYDRKRAEFFHQQWLKAMEADDER